MRSDTASTLSIDQAAQIKSKSDGNASGRKKLATYKGVRQEKMFSSTAIDILESRRC